MKHDNDNHTLTYLSVCSGIEAASVAWHPLGWRAVGYSEIEKFPSAVLAHHYPDVPNLGDFTKIDTTTLGRVDVLAGGTPCFTAGHMVLSARGYVPIEDIKVGDEVVTHKGRLRTVVRIGNERKEVGVLTGVGMCEPITCTPDHPFLSVEWRNQNTRRNNLYTKVEHCGQPEWVAAKEMPGRQWCQLLSHDNDNRAPESAKFDVKTAMYIAGMYLGDGWIRKHEGKAKKSVVLGINPKKYVKLKAAIGNAVHTVSHERTIVRVSIHDTAFADWLEAEFAHYSHLKTVPSWVMGHGFRGEFLRGFLDTDGSVAKDGKVSISTTSRSRAYGISDLMAAEGYVSSVALVETPDTCVIEGRTCSQRDYYQVRAYPQSVSRKSRVRHGMMLRTVSDFTPAGEATVFNIEVEEDHSYIVQSAIVHNCQAFSVAGLRQSLADARGNLSLEFVRLAHELADGNGLRNVVWENVVGVLSTKDNAFGCFLAGLVGADSAIEPPARGKWPRHGMVSGPKGRASWAVKDAQFFGVAQRRRRVLVVADFGNGADPAAVLFEPESVCRHPPTRGEAGQSITHPVAPSLVSSGRGIERTGDTRGQDPVVAVLRGHSDYGTGAPTLRAKGGDCAGGSEALVYAPEIARCDATREGSSQDYETTTMVAVGTAYSIARDAIDRSGEGASGTPGERSGLGILKEVTQTIKAKGPNAVCVTGEVTHSLTAEGHDAGEDGSGRGAPIVCVHADAIGRSGDAITPSLDAAGVPRIRNPGIGAIDDGTSYSLMASGQPHAVTVAIRGREGGATAELGGEVATALRASQGGGDKPHVLAAIPIDMRQASRGATMTNNRKEGQSGGAPGTGIGEPGDPSPTLSTSHPVAAFIHSAVRRLTPMECERLQGFHDGYTAIPWRGKPADQCPDGPRYKALGNSWAVPKFVWLGKRLQRLLAANDNTPAKEAA